MCDRLWQPSNNVGPVAKSSDNWENLTSTLNLFWKLCAQTVNYGKNCSWHLDESRVWWWWCEKERDKRNKQEQRKASTVVCVDSMCCCNQIVHGCIRSISHALTSPTSPVTLLFVYSTKSFLTSLENTSVNSVLQLNLPVFLKVSPENSFKSVSHRCLSSSRERAGTPTLLANHVAVLLLNNGVLQPFRILLCTNSNSSVSDMHQHQKSSLQCTWCSANLDFVARAGNKAVYLHK